MLIYSRGMTDHDKAAARREIADALLNALNRRHEVLDVIVDADDRPAAIDAVAGLLGTSHVAAELDDLNTQLSFTVSERPAASGESLDLRPFAAETDRDIFVARTTDVGSSGDGSGAPAADVDDEIGAALSRVDAEEAAWFVALEGDQKVGMVFGELTHGEVNVRIWIHPDFRKRGYGTAALRKCRSEMATYFPAVPMVVRAPGALPGA